MPDAQHQDRTFSRLRGFLRSERTPEATPARPWAGSQPDLSSSGRGSGAASAQSMDTCELCSVPLYGAHRHLLEADARRVVCACDPCALRFHDVLDGRYKLIPRDARALPNFDMTDLQWAAFGIPIGLAFIFRDGADGRHVALYPSPAGVTESDVPEDAWEDVSAANPVLDEMREDVEALLIDRLEDEALHFIAPIDRCYELSGLIRLHWRGFTGGEEVWSAVEAFFERLQRTARHS